MTIQPTFIAAKAIKEGKLQAILQAYAPEPLGLYAVYTNRKFLASKVRCFIDFITDYYGDIPYWESLKSAHPNRQTDQLVLPVITDAKST